MGVDFSENYLTRLVEVDERSRHNASEIAEINDEIKTLKEDNKVLYEMSASISSLATSVGGIKEDVKEIKDEQAGLKIEVQEIKDTPNKTKAKVVDDIGKIILTAIATGIVAFILGQVCPTIFG